MKNTKEKHEGKTRRKNTKEKHEGSKPRLIYQEDRSGLSQCSQAFFLPLDLAAGGPVFAVFRVVRGRLRSCSAVLGSLGLPDISL